MTSAFGSFASSALGGFLQSSVDPHARGEAGGTLVAATSNGVWAYDGGSTWTRLGSGVFPDTESQRCVAEVGGTLYAAPSGATTARSVRKYDPGSSTWTDIPLSASSLLVLSRCMTGHGDLLYAIAGFSDTATSTKLYWRDEEAGTWTAESSTVENYPPGALRSDVTKLTAMGGQPNPLGLSAGNVQDWDAGSVSWVDADVYPSHPNAGVPLSGFLAGGLRYVLSYNATDSLGNDLGSSSDDVWCFTVTPSAVTQVGPQTPWSYRATGLNREADLLVASDGTVWGTSFEPSASVHTVYQLVENTWTLRENSGNPFTGAAYAMIEHDGSVYVGMNLTLDGTTHRVVRWNGSEWEAPGDASALGFTVFGLATVDSASVTG